MNKQSFGVLTLIVISAVTVAAAKPPDLLKQLQKSVVPGKLPAEAQQERTRTLMFGLRESKPKDDPADSTAALRKFLATEKSTPIDPSTLRGFRLAELNRLKKAPTEFAQLRMLTPQDLAKPFRLEKSVLEQLKPTVGTELKLDTAPKTAPKPLDDLKATKRKLRPNDKSSSKKR